MQAKAVDVFSIKENSKKSFHFVGFTGKIRAVGMVVYGFCLLK